MGDSETGGGASVYWNINANDVRPGESHDQQAGNGRKQDGRDREGTIGDFFKVSIKIPAGGLPPELAALQPDPNDPQRVFFNLRIEDDKKQIRISWGNSSFRN